MWFDATPFLLKLMRQITEISEGTTASVTMAEMLCHAYLGVVFFHLGMPLVFMEVSDREETCWQLGRSLFVLGRYLMI